MTAQYLYDGTWEGFLSAVFTAYRVPGAVLCAEKDAEPSLFERREVETDPEQVRRVCAGADRKLGPDFIRVVESAWLTHEPGIDDALLAFIRRSFAAGRSLYDDRSDPIAHRVASASVRAFREAEKLMGFVRFRPAGRMYLADLEPDADLLPLIAAHFADRFQQQPFAIRDRKHMRALISDGRRYAILPFERFADDAPAPSDPLEAAWRGYYKAMTIEERKNPALRRQHMPKKYWRNLPEAQGLL